MSNFYVYVYIDPRNYEEFYFGKGKGSRKDAHLSETSDTEKNNRIRAIRAAGLDPIIRVIARNLTESEALLIEKNASMEARETTYKYIFRALRRKIPPS